MGIYCEACEEELTCKDCGVCDEDVEGGLCRDCRPKKKKYTDEQEAMFKILNENKELGRKVALKIMDLIDNETKKQKKQKKYKLKIVGVYQQ